MFGLTFVDVLIILALVFYVLTHVEEGVFALSRRLLALMGAGFIAYVSYMRVSTYVGTFIHLTPGVLAALTFLLLFLIFNTILNALFRRLVAYIPLGIQLSPLSRALAAIPAFIDGIILVTLVLFLLVIMPILPQVKAPIETSRLGNSLISTAAIWELELDKVFGKATEETFGFLTVHPKEDESVALPFHPTLQKEDREAEQQMLVLVNIERAKVGAKALVWSEPLAVVARAHSSDMWSRSYFAHENPDGLSPFDRLKAAGIKYRTAGENLALARTVERAHEGLMNSPGHKRNILDPEFGHVGIGVIDGGIYGKMFTQEFTN